ncbi:MAG: LuxR C-terminal-related transcriptional regulator [Anaerolineales bacterium]
MYNHTMLPLLRTKTTIPPTRPRQVERTRLLKQLEQGIGGALTLVVAPAGFGKTTLVAGWARTCAMPVAWLSLQPSDQARERFFAYLLQSLQSVAPHLGQTSLALMQAGSANGAFFALLNDLAELEKDFVLVLDDYHLVDRPEITGVLEILLEHRPATFHLVLIARAAPGLGLARLRALHQVVEITTDDLRFTESEAREFFETSMDLRLPPEALASLGQSTEGWAVGLQLAALTLARQPEAWQSFRGQEHVFDYLAEEVFRHESPGVQEFLKITALFDRFCLPLYEVIATHEREDSPAQDILEHIERANLFIISLGQAWYRYHALFTDFLRKQVEPEKSESLYLAASNWFEENGLLDDAIHYAVHAADNERAARLLETHYRDMLQRGEQASIKEWIACLPPDILDKHPGLWLAQGWASVISLEPTQALTYITKAEALFPNGKDGDFLRGEAKSLRILAGIFSGRVAAVEEISEAFVLLSEQDDFLHSLLHFNLGLLHVMNGYTAQAVDAFTEALNLPATQKNPLVAIFAQTQLGEVRHMRGALGLSERVFQQAIRYAQETLGKHSSLLGLPYIAYAELLREQNRFDESISLAEKGISYCHTWQPAASMDGHISLSRLLAARKEWDRAFQNLEDAMTEAENSESILDDTLVASQMARLALFQGDLPHAGRLINAYELEQAGRDGYYYLWEISRLVLLRARVLGVTPTPTLTSFSQDGTSLTLTEALSELIDCLQQRERVTPLIEALILLTYALHEDGKPIESAENLTRALTLGAQSGYLRIFADEGQKLLNLLEQYRPQLHAPRTYIDQILGILHQENTHHAPRTTHAAPPVPADAIPLTRRELDILTLLAEGKSNQEIAAERVLTVNTVKKHVANILSKMGVANRTHAVMQARKFGWID